MNDSPLSGILSNSQKVWNLTSYLFRFCYASPSDCARFERLHLYFLLPKKAFNKILSNLSMVRNIHQQRNQICRFSVSNTKEETVLHDSSSTTPASEWPDQRVKSREETKWRRNSEITIPQWLPGAFVHVHLSLHETNYLKNLTLGTFHQLIRYRGI